MFCFDLWGHELNAKGASEQGLIFRSRRPKLSETFKSLDEKTLYYIYSQLLPKPPYSTFLGSRAYV